MFADPGTNMAAANNGVVARALVNGGASVCQYQRTITLQPATDYILSAYLWNLGDAANHVTTVIDMNDAPGEPQITLSYSDANADQGYFVYRSFNTTTTGTNRYPAGLLRQPALARVPRPSTSRLGRSGTTSPLPRRRTSSPRPPLARTPTSTRSLPSPARPTARTSSLPTRRSPCNSSPRPRTPMAPSPMSSFTPTRPSWARLPSALTLCSWTIPASGSYQLTAVATDNQGATTVSAPVGISATVPASPPVPALRIFPAGTNFALYWPTSYTAVSLQCAASLISPDWQTVTNVPAIVSNQFTVTLPNTAAQRYFTLALTVDPSTLTGKLLMGYQGWFACPGDGSAHNRWVHWFSNNTPDADNAHFDFWPDTSELDADELFSTSMTYSNGSPAKLYSAYKQKTVVRHFKWMQDNHLDGVFFQRFLSDLPGGNLSALRNQVAVNVRVGAETYGRVFAIMYDISGYSTNTLVSKLTNDWLYLVNTQRVTNSPAYLRHNGKPVVAIWGFGFSGRPDTPQQAQQAIDWFKAAGCTVMGGLPTHWRTLTGDAQTNAAWSSAFRSFDVISPWSVGRYGDNSGADSFRVNQIVPDLADCTSHGIDYMPVIFPGFSWANLQNNGLLQPNPA